MSEHVKIRSGRIALKARLEPNKMTENHSSDLIM